MKLKWPLWAITLVWFLLHLIGFLSLAYGWLVNTGLVLGFLIYLIYGAFTQSVGYGVIVGKKTLEAWKVQSKDSTRVNNEDTNASLAWGYVIWLALPIIIYWPFFGIAIGEK